jgi:hypothetical protein
VCSQNKKPKRIGDDVLPAGQLMMRFRTKMDELREYLSPTGEHGGFYLIPLHPKYNRNEQCYSLVYD